MTITVEFDPPQPGDSREVFNNKAFDTVAKLNPWSQQANALALEVNDDAATAEAGAEIVNSVVNFRGSWDDLTGALSVPASCAHSSGYWILLESVADVTAHEPGVSAVWAMYESDFARLSGADFTGPITVPAGATGAQAVRASEAQWSGARVVANGSSITINGIPSGVSEVMIQFLTTGLPAASNLLIQLGNAGGVLETGYYSMGAAVTTTVVSPVPINTGFQVRSGAVTASSTRGSCLLKRSPTTNDWTASGTCYGDGDDRVVFIQGVVNLGGEITQVRLKPDTGDFTGGHVAVHWRY